MSAQDNGGDIAATNADALAEALKANTSINSDDQAADAASQSEESVADESSDSAAEDTSAQDSDNEDTEDNSQEDVAFDFQGTHTGVERLVQKFDKLDADAQSEKIKNLKSSGRTKELEAIKEAFPDAFAEKQASPTITEEQLDALVERKLKEKGLDPTILEKLGDTLPRYESQIRDQMLKEVLGKDYDKVLEDPKFLSAYNKFGQLNLEERLEVACSMSPIARKLKYDQDYAKESRSRNATVPKKGTSIQNKPKNANSAPTNAVEFREANSPQAFLKALKG
jgi:hypothetical protein